LVNTIFLTILIGQLTFSTILIGFKRTQHLKLETVLLTNHNRPKNNIDQSKPSKKEY